MARGGPRQAPPGAVPGVGANSQRTDGNALGMAPGLDRPDIQSGDVGMIEDAMRAVPVSPAPGLPAAPAPSGGPPSLQELRGQPVPDGFFDQPTGRPGEPETAGLDMGAGPGSDILANPPVTPTEANAVLQYVARLAEHFSSQDAADILAAYQQPAEPAMPDIAEPPIPQGALDDGEDFDADVDFEEGHEGDIDLTGDDETDLLEGMDDFDEEAPVELGEGEGEDFDEEGDLDDDELAELEAIEAEEGEEGAEAESADAEGQGESAPADSGGEGGGGSE